MKYHDAVCVDRVGGPKWDHLGEKGKMGGKSANVLMLYRWLLNAKEDSRFR